MGWEIVHKLWTSRCIALKVRILGCSCRLDQGTRSFFFWGVLFCQLFLISLLVMIRDLVGDLDELPASNVPDFREVPQRKPPGKEVRFNASPGLKQIYNWSCTHLLPRKFKISSFLKLETCFLRRVASTPNAAKMTKFGHFRLSLAAKVAWWPPILFVFRIRSTISHSCRNSER